MVTIIDPLNPSETCSPHQSPQLPSAQGGKVRSPKKVLRSGGEQWPGSQVRCKDQWLSGEMGPLTIRFYPLLVTPAWGAAAGQARYKCTNIQLLETNQNVDGISNWQTLQISRYSCKCELMINVHSYFSSLEPKHEIEANIGIALASSHNDDQIDNFKKKLWWPFSNLSPLNFGPKKTDRWPASNELPCRLMHKVLHSPPSPRTGSDTR